VIDNNNNVVDLDGPRLAPTPPPPPAPAVKEDSSSNFYFGSTDHGDGAERHRPHRLRPLIFYFSSFSIYFANFV
jgi:hypothetical protein